MYNNFIIKSEKTAISNGQSESNKLIISRYSNNSNNLQVLDYGCGRLRNAKKLVEHGFKVSILDTMLQLKKITKEEFSLFNDIYSRDNIKYILNIRKYNIILCSFVINVIENNEERIEVLNNINNLLLSNGKAFLEVRKETSLKGTKYKRKYKDGYIIGNSRIRTFQKTFTCNEFKNLIMQSNLEIEEVIEKSNSVIIVCKKGGCKAE